MKWLICLNALHFILLDILFQSIVIIKSKRETIIQKFNSKERDILQYRFGGLNIILSSSNFSKKAISGRRVEFYSYWNSQVVRIE